MAKKIIQANDVLADVCALLGLPADNVRRIVLELTPGEPAHVGVELLPEDSGRIFATVVKRHVVTTGGELVEAGQ